MRTTARSALLIALACGPLLAQTAYKYRDTNGQWVFTDRGAPAAAASGSFTLDKEDSGLRLTVERVDKGCH